MPTTSRPADPINRATNHIATPATQTVTPRGVNIYERSATGTSTCARISWITTAGERPVITASAVTMIRCASPGTQSNLTSSGIT